MTIPMQATEFLITGNISAEGGIDRTVFGLRIPQKPSKGPVTKAMWDEYYSDMDALRAKSEEIEMLLKHHPSYKCFHMDGEFRRYVFIGGESGDYCHSVLIGESYNSPIVNFTINPSKMTMSSWNAFLSMATLMFPNGYVGLFQKSVVSHVEFYVDVYGVNRSDIHLISDSRRKLKTPHEGTEYFGGRRGKRTDVCYDKGKQMNESASRVRIEPRYKRRELFWGEMIDLQKNPLEKLYILQSKNLQPIAKEMKCPPLEELLPKVGIRAVQNKYARKKLLSLIADQSPDWWQPEKFGAGLRGMLKLLEPTNVYKMVGIDL
jgi:hypothetical protein